MVRQQGVRRYTCIYVDAKSIVLKIRNEFLAYRRIAFRSTCKSSRSSVGGPAVHRSWIQNIATFPQDAVVGSGESLWNLESRIYICCTCYAPSHHQLVMFGCLIVFIIVRPILTDLSQQHFKMYNENFNLSPKSTAEPCYELRETTVKPPKPALEHTGRGGTVGPKAPIVYAVYVRFLNDTFTAWIGGTFRKKTTCTGEPCCRSSRQSS